MSTGLAVAVTVYGLLMSCAPVLQLRAMLRTRSSANVSIAYFVVLLVGFALWGVYGVAIANPALIVTNAASLVATATTVSVALVLRRQERARATPSTVTP